MRAVLVTRLCTIADLWQVEGERHMLLVPPEHALDGRLAPFGFAHPYATYSAPGLASTACEAADEALAEHVCGLWPAFKQVCRTQRTLATARAWHNWHLSVDVNRLWQSI